MAARPSRKSTAAKSGTPKTGGGAAWEDVPLRHRMVQVVMGHKLLANHPAAGLEGFQAAHPELVLPMLDATWIGERVPGISRPEETRALAMERRLRGLLPAELLTSSGLLPFSVAVYETDVSA